MSGRRPLAAAALLLFPIGCSGGSGTAASHSASPRDGAPAAAAESAEPTEPDPIAAAPIPPPPPEGPIPADPDAPEPPPEQKAKWDAWRRARLARERAREVREMGYRDVGNEYGVDGGALGRDERVW